MITRAQFNAAMKEFKRVRAVFNPPRVDNLRTDMLKYIGKEFVFERAWRMGKGDPYPKEWALLLAGEDNRREFFAYWVPEHDLELLEILTTAERER